jgi:hypothetical protein
LVVEDPIRECGDREVHLDSRGNIRSYQPLRDHPTQPRLVLFAASTLTEVGAALRAQPDADELEVRFSEDA